MNRKYWGESKLRIQGLILQLETVLSGNQKVKPNQNKVYEVQLQVGQDRVEELKKNLK